MKNTIKRKYKKNRQGEYNGKIAYSLQHNGEEITRTSSNNYLYAAIIKMNRPSERYNWKTEQYEPWHNTRQEITWSSKPITESRVFNLVGWRAGTSPYDSSNERSIKKAANEKRIKEARAAGHFKITYYQVDQNTEATKEYKAWAEAWSEICELSHRDLESEIKEITEPEQAAELEAAVRKSPSIADDKRGSLLQMAKLAGRTILYARYCRMTIEERRTPEQMILPGIIH